MNSDENQDAELSEHDRLFMERVAEAIEALSKKPPEFWEEFCGD